MRQLEGEHLRSASMREERGGLAERRGEGFGNCSASDVEWKKGVHGEGAVGCYLGGF